MLAWRLILDWIRQSTWHATVISRIAVYAMASIPIISNIMDRFVELSALVRTVDRGSQAAAARELGITAAMVGRYIQGLEDRLGTRLLNRTTARQSLTEAGRRSMPAPARSSSSWMRRTSWPPTGRRSRAARCGSMRR